jgi:hypothetical protein
VLRVHRVRQEWAAQAVSAGPEPRGLGPNTGLVLFTA